MQSAHLARIPERLGSLGPDAGWAQPVPRGGEPATLVDVAGVVSQFLSELSSIDLVVELVQNELDAGSKRTEITFGHKGLVCRGYGRAVDAKGWKRLSYVLGAGGVVEAKTDGIGSKNHGLRAAFLIGDEITVQSGGLRIDLTVRGQLGRPDAFYPAVWPPIADVGAPRDGTRITVPYRSRSLPVPERNPLEPILPDDVDALFADAVEHAADRFLCASAPGRRWRYELVLSREGGPSHVFTFVCEPMWRRPGIWLRTCTRGMRGRRPTVVARRAGAPFEFALAPDDRAKVPRLYRWGSRVRGELCWAVDTGGAPVPGVGALRYPIAYPIDQIRTGAGFDISGPFISGRARHSVSDDARNGLIVEAARANFVELLADRLIPSHGPAALTLVGDAALSNEGVEDGIVAGLLAHGGVPTFAAVGQGSVKVGWGAAAPDRPVAIVAPSYDPSCISAELAGLLPATVQALHPETPASFVRALLRALAHGRRGVSRADERDAAQAVLVAGAPVGGESASADWIARCATVLRQLQTARNRDTLKPDFARALREQARLPTTAGTAVLWKEVWRSVQPPPSVPGVLPPAILHASLLRIGLLKDGATRVPPFKLDAYVSGRNFETVAAEGRQNFFEWLRKGRRQLLPQTLAGITRYPIWPGADGKYRPLDAYCCPRNEPLRTMMRESMPAPAPELLAFPGLARATRGALRLRTRPTSAELRGWHVRRISIARELANGPNPRAVAAYVARTEAGLDALRGDPAWPIHEIGAGHLTLSAVGGLVPVMGLHIRTPRTERCRLLPKDLARGDWHTLYAALGGLGQPSLAALLGAMRSAPCDEALFERLEAYEDGRGVLADLSEEAVVLVRGTPMPPGHLCFPSTTNWWGEWKTSLERAPDEPARTALLERAGVVRPALREELSRSFFAWLSSQPISVQRRHRQQVVRHWAERRHGPSRWIQRFPDLRCIAVHGFNNAFELVSRNQVGLARARVFLPDFPEVQESMLRDDAQARLAVADAHGVDGSVLTLLRDAGVPSLRERAGRPVRLRWEGEPVSDAALDAELASVRSPEMLRTLPKRLPQHDVPTSALRPSWRRMLRELSGVICVPRLFAVHRLLRREYELPTVTAINEPTGVICVSVTADRRLALYDALARHLFTDTTSALSAYGLLRAVQDDYLVTFPDDGAEDADEDTPEDEPAPAGSAAGIDRAPRLGHVALGNDEAPFAPEPGPLAAIARPTDRAERRVTPRPTPVPASPDPRRDSVEEEEQRRQLKERHYAWHCQACLGRYDVLEAAPPQSYLYLPGYRRSLIEAHHVEHIQNEGGLGASNLLILCRYHHRLLGDRLSRPVVRGALTRAIAATRAFPTDTEGLATTAREGLIATVVSDGQRGDAMLYFTAEHAASWLADDRNESGPADARPSDGGG